MAALNKELDPRFAKAFGVFAGVIAFLILYFYFASLGKLIPVHSDRAYLALYAQEILSGNYLLSDWHLTTVGFYNEIPFYIVAVKLMGLQTDVMRLVPAFVFTINTALVCALIWKHRVRSGWWIFIPVLIYIVAPSNGAWIHFLQGASHHVTTSYMLACMLLLPKDFVLDGSKSAFIALLLVSYTAALSDLSFIYLFIGPLIVAIVWAFRDDKQQLRASLLTLALPMAASAFLGQLTVTALKSIGAGSAPGLGPVAFEQLDRLSLKLSSLTADWITFFGANFFGMPLNLLSLSVLLIGTGVVLWACAFREGLSKGSPLEKLLIAMLVSAVVLCTISYRGETLDNARFLLPSYLGAVFMLGLFLQRIEWRSSKVVYAVLLFSCLIISSRFVSDKRLLIAGDQYGNRLTEPLRILRERGLTNGFTDYWTGHLLRVASGNALDLCPIAVAADGSITAMHWACDADWIRGARGNFAILAGEHFGNPADGPNSRDKLEAASRRYWGEPLERIETNGMIILIWPSDRVIGNEELPPHLRSNGAGS